MRDLGDRLRRQRIARGFDTQKDFWAYARVYGLDMPLRRYGAIERGEAQANMLEMRSICSALRWSADQWLFGSDAVLDVRELNKRDVTLLAGIAGLMIGVQ